MRLQFGLDHIELNFFACFFFSLHLKVQKSLRLNVEMNVVKMFETDKQADLRVFLFFLPKVL